MSSIGPQIPAHLLQHNVQITDEDASDQEGDFGPQIPASLLSQRATTSVSKSPNRSPTGVEIGPSIPKSVQRVVDGDDDDDDDGGYGPALPPHLAAARSAGPSKLPESNSTRRPAGPMLPSQASYAYDDDDSDDDFGPKPLPSGVQFHEPDAVQRFMELEEKRRKNAEEAAKPKAPKRDEWMLVPPTSSNLLGSLDPTKLKARQFSRSTAGPKSKDNSLWTETPQERMQRLADEVSGKKKRAVDQTEDAEVTAERAKRRREDEIIERGVERHTRQARGSALVSQHKAGLANAGQDQEDKKDTAIWDHGRDMSIGGRLMDDGKRNQMLREAKGLGDRFGSSSKGRYM